MQSPSDHVAPPGRAPVRMHHFVRTPLVALAMVEAVALLCAPILAAVLLDAWALEARLPLPAAAFAALQLVALLSVGLYSRRQRARLDGILLRVLAAVVAGAAAFVLLSYLIPVMRMPRAVVFASVGLAVVLLSLTRLAFERLVDEEVFKRRVLVYGAGRRSLALTQLRRRHDRRGF